MVAIVSNQRDVILDAVRRMYTDVATAPDRTYHFPTGRRAGELVGYPADLLDLLPAAAVESFAGVGYPFLADVIRPGDAVLDVGSGSGTDTLIASRLVGPAGRVIGLDLTPAMRDKLRATAAAAGAGNVEVLAGDAEAIPLPDASVDVVTSNGVLNLVPDKGAAIREIGRVLRPGGWLQLADIVVRSLPSEACRSHPELWAECIVGATTVAAYRTELGAAGLERVEVLREQDYFAASPSGETRKVAGSFGAHAVVLRARRS
ncbi:MAG TPA: methyltransferase domain-containing protein [Gemmatimonadales bacterium]|nr:methyltransferase domain-containing protein [Gemmatimonadales bacterium]